MPSPSAFLATAALLTVLAGCSGPDVADGPGQPGSPEAGVAPGPPLLETPVHVEGSTALGACAAGQCRYEMTDTAFGRLPEAGLAVRLAGTLTWDSVSPSSETLTVYVPRLVDGEYQWGQGDPAASGTSPLAFDLDLGGLNATSLGLVVGNGVATGSPLGVFAVQTPQPFVLDATYTTLG